MYCRVTAKGLPALLLQALSWATLRSLPANTALAKTGGAIGPGRAASKQQGYSWMARSGHLRHLMTGSLDWRSDQRTKIKMKHVTKILIQATLIRATDLSQWARTARCAHEISSFNIRQHLIIHRFLKAVGFPRVGMRTIFCQPWRFSSTCHCFSCLKKPQTFLLLPFQLRNPICWITRDVI